MSTQSNQCCHSDKGPWMEVFVLKLVYAGTLVLLLIKFYQETLNPEKAAVSPTSAGVNNNITRSSDNLQNIITDH